MRRILVCTGVLGGGTALVFALAALTATLFPHGTIVNNPWAGTWGGGMFADDVMVRGPLVVGEPAIDLAVPEAVP